MLVIPIFFIYFNQCKNLSLKNWFFLFNLSNFTILLYYISDYNLFNLYDTLF